ncbi:Hypothetical protein RMP42_05863 (plasmid) [Roseomonas mucosa]|nr:Hypothetical protein RMP42_05863 [Roseomonas mucosa]
MRLRPPRQILPSWDSSRPETHRQLAALWAELLQRRLRAGREEAQEPHQYVGRCRSCSNNSTLALRSNPAPPPLPGEP